MNQSRTVFLRIVCAAALCAMTAAGNRALARDEAPVERLIVKLRDQGVAQPMSEQRRQALIQRAGVALTPARVLANGAQLLRLPHRMRSQDAEALAAQLQTDPAVEYAEPDRRRYPALVPNDPRYSEQWYLYEDAGGMRLPGAWDISTGSSGVVVAVVDSGYRPHSEFAARILPGYDMISDLFTANDGDGRDADASDPGDWITAAEATRDCPAADSSWHGTMVTGLIAATGDNLAGIAGIDWQAQILPVRVLGKCGGFTSDIVDGMYWAAGLHVNGVPDNPHPAQVINLSLGGTGPCSSSEQSAVNAALAAGTAVVVAAGNESGSVSNSSPADCTGVIAVAATNRAGSKSSYTNTGSRIAVSAPGGDDIDTNDTLLTTSNSGLTTPGTDSYAGVVGTSFSSAEVSGVVALMLAVQPLLTPAQVKSLLRSSARAFPDISCNTSSCGAGIVDAAAALSAAQTFNINSGGTGGNTGAGGGGTSSGGGGGGGALDPGVLLITSCAWLALRRRRSNGRARA